ncbi:hypothetical protein [Pseudomonas jilinensis]|uniref:Transcriptional regulator SutA RNAP-binding domain-containing protein n=1 Tax=Pseudomonas jilinensis TaxID=2078689 RepID=A0A396RYX3_9PSED|nr:hypothetical protein [Pseudomonas jilinensis]RHW20632.1 hypothetical protein C2846_13445 [Pseudomonas jilinensis]
MSDDDIEDDDIDGVDDSDVDDLPETDDDEPVASASSKGRKKAAEEDELEGASLEAKAREREMLARQIEEFMARGGKVQEIGDNVVSDPPKKPDSKYGSRPI